MRFKSLYILTIVAAEVALVCSHYLLALGKLGGVFLKLRIYGVEIRNGIAPFGAGNINKMYQQTAAVDMAQKIVAETCPFGSALDYAGNRVVK